MTSAERMRIASEVLKAKMGLGCQLECPECGAQGPHEVNEDPREPTMLCLGCGYQHDVLELREVKEALDTDGQ